jgi:tetratricopeptide (TPR) repeat protein
MFALFRFGARWIIVIFVAFFLIGGSIFLNKDTVVIRATALDFEWSFGYKLWRTNSNSEEAKKEEAQHVPQNFVGTSKTYQDFLNDIEEFRKAIDIDPNDPDLYYYLAQAYLGINKTDYAVAVYKEGLNQGLHKSHLYFHLAVLYEKLGKYTESINSYESSIAAFPNDPFSYVGLAKLHKRLGESWKEKVLLKKCVLVTSSPYCKG